MGKPQKAHFFKKDQKWENLKGPIFFVGRKNRKNLQISFFLKEKK